MAINPLPPTTGGTPSGHRPIGELLAEAGRLTEHDIRRVIALQRKKGVRFGEAARSLGLVNDDDIQRALARQFNYTYIRRGESGLNPMLVSAYQPFGLPAETFRILRSQLALRWFDHGRKTLAIGSARGGAGAQDRPLVQRGTRARFTGHCREARVAERTDRARSAQTLSGGRGVPCGATLSAPHSPALSVRSRRAPRRTRAHTHPPARRGPGAARRSGTASPADRPGFSRRTCLRPGRGGSRSS